MNYKNIYLILFLCVLPSCSFSKPDFFYSNLLEQEIEEITGIIIKDQSITYGTLVDPSSGKPKQTSGYWNRSLNFDALNLSSNSEASFEDLILDNYLLHRIATQEQYEFAPLIMCHTFSFKNLAIPNSYLKPYNVFYNEVSLAQIFFKNAINQAKIELSGLEKSMKIKFSSEFMKNFELELRNQIEENSSSQLNIKYILITMGFGLSFDVYNNHLIPTCSLKTPIITGIAGLIITKYNSKVNVFKRRWFEVAFNNSVKSEDTQIVSKINLSILGDLSATWERRTNIKLRTVVKTRNPNPLFYPLWYRSYPSPD